MKRFIQFFAVVSIAGSLSLFAGCEKEGSSRASGKDVVFGAKARNELTTRTEYGDYDNASAPTHQDIKWVSGDKIRIYSPSSVRRVAYAEGTPADQCYHWADYDVSPKSDDPTLGQLMNSADGNYINSSKEKGEVGNGLIWISETSTFYGIYPTPDTYEGTGTALDGVSGKFSLSLPSTQAYSEKGNMDYAYMVAAAENIPQGTNPLLKFNPAYTAFEISVKSASEAVSLSKFELISETDNIVGSYTAQAAGSGDTYTYPSEGGKIITVDLSGKSAPASTASSPLVFTVFAMPKTVSGLSVRFTLANGVKRTLALNNNVTESQPTGTPISFTGGKKHRIYGLFLPSSELMISVGTAPWGEGGEHTYTTIEDVTTFFISYNRYNATNPGSDSWAGNNYIAVAPGRSTDNDINIGTEDNPQWVPSNVPLYSPMITLTTVSTGTALILASDNPKVGLVTADADGIYPLTPVQSITIPASTLENPIHTVYFVVPTSDCPEGAVANITLVRADLGTPIAWSHYDMPGTTDHTKVPYKVLSVDHYQTMTVVTVPSI
ncbi:MAG: hypothetical protein IKH00_03970 [Bacteroidales bacterium]|nr:hypothetical protein [Bacteroidales bacterium]